MNRSIQVVLMIFLVVQCPQLFAQGAEAMDPIYKDLSTLHQENEKAHLEAKAKIVELRSSIDKAAPNSIEMKDLRKELAKVKSQSLRAEQMARYYKIRAERRKVHAQIAAREAKEAGKEWPDPKEYSDYLVNKRLRDVNLNWNARVPKLQERLVRTPAAKAEKKAEAPAEE